MREFYGVGVVNGVAAGVGSGASGAAGTTARCAMASASAPAKLGGSARHGSERERVVSGTLMAGIFTPLRVSGALSPAGTTNPRPLSMSPWNGRCVQPAKRSW
jgi:hypothetical protein